MTFSSERFKQMKKIHTRGARRRGERGAALVTTLLMSTLLLSAGGALIVTTTMSATTAVDSTAEMQAYYAAEAGLEAGLAVLRRNVAPGTPGTSADFRTVVCGAAANCTNTGGNLSTWLGGSVVTLSTANAATSTPPTSYALNVRDAAFAPGAPLPPAPYLPRFLVVTSTGRGPKGSVKVLEMTVDAFSFDFTTRAAVAVRSNSTNTAAMASFSLGNSSPHEWNGQDHAATPLPPLSAFAVTNDADYQGVDGPGGTMGKAEAVISEDGSNVIGSNQLTKINPNDLEAWLQNADNARAFLSEMRQKAASTGRLNPSNFGSPSNPKFSFVDGNVDFSGGDHGAGLLIVTGNYSQGGSSSYNGIVLVLGEGNVSRNGTPDLGGALVVARFQHNYDASTKSYTGTGNFLSPTIVTSGGGNSLVGYNSDDVRKAMEAGGCRVIGIVEK
jgi:hypothetical protein